MQLKKVPALVVLIASLGLGAYGLHMMYNQKYNNNNNDTMVVDDSGKPISAVAEVKTSNDSSTKDKNRSNTNKKGSGIVNSNLKECYERAHKVSNKVIGWLYIDGTAVNYPVMSGESNNYWLTRSWKGKPSVDGSIFLDESQYSFGHENLIHGHNMANGSMFASLRRFKDKNFFDGEHLVYLYTGTQVKVYKVFSVFLVPQTFTFKVNISDKDALGEYAKSLYDKSMFKSVKSNQNDLLILNTCVSDGTNRHQITVAQEIN